MRRPLSLITSVFLAWPLYGDNLIDSLNSDMINAAQIATQTNQNIDYQPFILSVWEQNDLYAFGARTLKDALMLVPGIDMMGDSMNNRTPVVRGSNPLAYGQTKLAIDGIVVNDRTFDSYNAYLDVPVEMIKRIEVVRGSGSFIEGVNGYSGTINVITYAQDESAANKGSLFGALGSNNGRQAGFWSNSRLNGWKIASDIFYQRNDALSPTPVTDKYGNVGYAPLNSSQLGIGVSLSRDNVYLKGRLNRFTSGSAFGNLYALPNPEGEQSTPSWYIEGGYAHRVNSDLELRLKAGMMEDSWKSNARSLPPGTYGTITYPVGYWANLSLKNRLRYANVAATYEGLEKQKIIFGYTLKYEDAVQLSSVTTERVDGATAMVDYTATAPFLDAGSACRHTHEVYLNDTIDLSEHTAFSFYGGAMRASDVDYHSYLRAALVYQPEREHIFKLMAGNSFRLPSWQELYTLNNPARIGNPNLEPEKVTSYEAQYLYKPSVSTTLDFNVFYLKNQNQITASDPQYTFENIGSRNILGFESEFRGSFGENDLTALSYSYIRGETIKGNEHTDYLPYASSHLLKGAFSYRFAPQWRTGVTGRYTSPKKRLATDSRPAMHSMATLDLNLGWENRGFYVQYVIKNITDGTYHYPSPPGTYPDDYAVEGRTMWIRTGWKF